MITTTNPIKSCLCGCGSVTKGGKFAPGHDARLKGRLIRAHRSGDTTAQQQLVELGWGRFIGVEPVRTTPLVFTDDGDETRHHRFLSIDSIASILGEAPSPEARSYWAGGTYNWELKEVK